MSHYIFVTGGVVSSLGKGITAASLGYLLKARGLRVTLVKIDPYLNVDAGTMNPFQHGEVFVTDDGAESDLDLGHYERFLDENLTRRNNITTGQVYQRVIEKERRGAYLGNTVQVIPHVTDEIKAYIREAAEAANAEVTIVEIGGTVGDIEGLPFLEAIRQMRLDEGPARVAYLHVTLIPYLAPTGEAKTKPTQHSVRELRSIGISPDALMCRTRIPLTPEMRRKLSLFCDVPPEAVFSGPDTDNIYELPLEFEAQGLPRIVLQQLGLPDDPPDHAEWTALVERIRNPRGTVSIALVGKYTGLKDSYLSVVEALRHGGFANDVTVDITWVDAEQLDPPETERALTQADGVLVPGGFGARGIEGKIAAVRYARETGKPFLGLCLGLQVAVIEFARHGCGLDGAHSTEFAPDTPHPVIHLLPSQRGVAELGGTMRLGAYPCTLAPDSRAAAIYGEPVVMERHRHRYEVNNDYRDTFEQHGLRCSGIYVDEDLVETIELPDHPYFTAIQAHPEFRSRPTRPHPLFREFIAAALRHADERHRLLTTPTV